MDETRYAELVGRIDAAETVMRILLRHVSFRAEGGEEAFKAEVLEYADGMRATARGNRISLAQADAMDGYVGRARFD